MMTWGGIRKPGPVECPDDFEVVFVRIGRLACEEHYGVGKSKVDGWLEERDKDALIAARLEQSKRDRKEREAKAREAKGLTRREVSRILSRAFKPVSTRDPSYTLTRHAAQYLRVHRNGGFIISPAGEGLWWIGTRKRTASELLELAKAKGFDPKSICRTEVEEPGLSPRELKDRIFRDGRARSEYKRQWHERIKRSAATKEPATLRADIVSGVDCAAKP